MDYSNWIGRTRDISDSMAPEQLQRLEALMDGDPKAVTTGTNIRSCGHWVYFNLPVLQSELGVNGHERQGDFLPPVELPVRMWAGGHLKFKKPLRTSVPAEKKSTILNIEEKEGSSGKLCFLTIRHQVSARRAVAIDEEQVLVYRQESEEGAHPIRTEPLDIDPDWSKTVQPDSVQLFRFSALTFNSHRIHYDQEYAREVEGYPNILVHAPYLVMMVIDAFSTGHDGKKISSLEYEAVGPVYLGEELTISGKSVENTKTALRVHGPEGKLAMKVKIDWSYSWQA